MENRSNSFAAVEFSIAYRVAAFLKSSSGVRWAISIITFLAFFVILVFDGESVRLGAVFVMVTTSVVISYALMAVLWAISIIEMLTENIIDCFFPRMPTPKKVVEAQKAYNKMTKQEKQEFRFRENCRLYSLTLKDYIQIKKSRKEDVTAQEARHFWYFLAEYQRLAKRIEPGDVYTRIHLEQLKELHPDHTKNYSVDQLNREYEKYRMPEWEQFRNQCDPSCTRVLQIMLDNFAETFSKSSGYRYAKKTLTECLIAALHKYESYAGNF